MGRTLEFSDRPEVDHIADELKEKGLGMQDLVLLIVKSDAFQTK